MDLLEDLKIKKIGKAKIQFSEFGISFIIFSLLLVFTFVVEQLLEGNAGKISATSILATGISLASLVSSIIYLLLFSKNQALNLVSIELQRHNIELSTILNNIADGIVVVNRLGHVIFINPIGASMIGWSAGEIMGKDWNEIVSVSYENGEPVERNQCVLAEALYARRLTKNIYRYYRKDKTFFLSSLVGNPILIDDDLWGAVLTFRDITRAREIDRAKTEFVSLASHQLRTPLSTINWYAEMLLEPGKAKLGIENFKYIQEIYNANQRMTALLNALLNISRLELGTFAIEHTESNISKIVENILEGLAIRIRGAKLHLQKKIGENLSKVIIDANVFQNILGNLLSNAIKYTPEGGSVSLQIERQDKSLYVIVSDTGYGIPREQQPQVFKKFFRADNIRSVEAEGTGLGLYIVKTLLEKIGGDIAFESEENKGTRFYVHIPINHSLKK